MINKLLTGAAVIFMLCLYPIIGVFLATCGLLFILVTVCGMLGQLDKDPGKGTDESL